MTAVKIYDKNLDKLKGFKVKHKKDEEANINFQDMVNNLIEKATYDDAVTKAVSDNGTHKLG